MSRAVNAEINLDPGRYHVLMKTTAYRQRDVESTEEVVSRLAPIRREKLVQIGLSYDLAHAKGLVAETGNERKEREEDEERRRTAERQRLRDETKQRLQKEWIRERKLEARQERLEARRQRAEAGKHAKQNGSGCLNDGSGMPGDFDITPTNGVVPAIQFNGEYASRYTNDRGASLPSPDSRLSSAGLDPSNADFLEGFEFDSDLDMPPEEPVAGKAAPEPEPAPAGYPEGINNDPWNAVCVVGLRVYSQDPQLSLQVIHPVPEDDTEAALDCDDPAASATNEESSWTRTSI
jgi:hypothetical protein